MNKKITKIINLKMMSVISSLFFLAKIKFMNHTIFNFMKFKSIFISPTNSFLLEFKSNIKYIFNSFSNKQ